MLNTMFAIAGPSGASMTTSDISRVRRMMLAAQCLSEPSKVLFDRLFLKGESEGDVRANLGLTEAEFGERHQNMLRSLMVVSE